MPIRSERAALYPKDWPEISQRIRARADNRCEFCGVANYALGGRRDGKFHAALPLGDNGLRLIWPRPGTFAHCEGVDWPLRIIKIVLTVAHLDHDETSADEANLRALCQKCHLTYDAKHHARNAAATLRSRRALGDLFA